MSDGSALQARGPEIFLYPCTHLNLLVIKNNYRNYSVIKNACLAARKLLSRFYIRSLVAVALSDCLSDRSVTTFSNTQGDP